MKTYQFYIEEFKTFAQNAIDSNKPKGNSALQQGTISRMQTFISDFGDKIQNLNKVLVDKANQILAETDNNNKVDSVKLKNELFDLGKQAIYKFISKYKPQ